jgi:hypothetical protein
VDSEPTPQRGQDPGLIPPEQGADHPASPAADPWAAAGGTPRSGEPAWPGPGGTGAPGAGYPAAPGQPPRRDEFPAAPPPGYQAPGAGVSYQAPAPPSGFPAPDAHAWLGDPAGPAGFQAPGAPPGYPAAAGPYGFEQPGAPPGYPDPNGPYGYGEQGYPPGATPSYHPQGGPQDYQAAGPGYQGPEAANYQAGTAPSGYPAAGYQSTVPLPGDLATGAPSGYQPAGWGNVTPAGGYIGTQPGYQGAQWQGASPPRRRGLLVGVVALAAAVIAGVVTSIILVTGQGESPTAMALQAGQAIAPSAGVGLSGSFDQAAANLTVTKAGTVEGTYSQEAFPATRLTINGVTYLKAPAGFWNLQQNISQAAAGQAGGNWAKAPASDVTTFSSLTPAQIAGVLEHVGNQPKVTDTTVGGQKVIKLTAGGANYYITTATPNRLLRIDGSISGTAYSFSIKPLTAATIGPVYTVMKGYVQALQGAQDPEANLTSGTNISFANDCSTSTTSCTVSIKVTVTDPGSATVLITMNAAFSGTKNGTAFGNCNATVPAATNNSSAPVTVTPQCALTGQAWTGWVDSQSGEFSTWVSTTFGAEVNSASDITALQSTLSQQQG